MSQDAGARKIVELLEAPSTELEAALEALADSLEAAHPTETEPAQLPQSALAPIGRLQGYYRGLHRQVAATESGDGRGRAEAQRALTRMEEGLKSFAEAVGKEGEDATKEAKAAAAAMGQAGDQIDAAIGRLR